PPLPLSPLPLSVAHFIEYLVQPFFPTRRSSDLQASSLVQGMGNDRVVVVVQDHGDRLRRGPITIDQGVGQLLGVGASNPDPHQRSAEDTPGLHPPPTHLCRHLPQIPKPPIHPLP